MHLVQEGDPRAFELLYDRHCGPAFSLAYRMVGNRVTAEDISQEAFLSIWRSRLRYQPDRGSVRTWVLGIVHHRAIDALRRNLVHDKRRASAEGIEERFEAPEQTDVEVARRDEARTVRARPRRAARRAVPGDRAGLLRRLLPQPDRRACWRCRSARSRAGCGLAWTSCARQLAEGAGMSVERHEMHEEDVGAYLLGALSDEEDTRFERHLSECHRLPGRGRAPAPGRGRPAALGDPVPPPPA